MKRPGLAATAPLALAFSLAACGSLSDIDQLFQNSSGAGGSTTTTAGQGGATGGTTGVGGSVASTSVSSGGATTTSTTTGQGTTTTGTTTTGTTGSGSSTTSSGSSSSGSSSSGGPTSTVYCSNAPCAAGEICCFYVPTPKDYCGQPNTCGNGYIEFGCNGPEDCPGGICCADIDRQKSFPYEGISCKQSCNNPLQNRIVCSDADPSCPPGTQCEADFSLGLGYKLCM